MNATRCDGARLRLGLLILPAILFAGCNGDGDDGDVHAGEPGRGPTIHKEFPIDTGDQLSPPVVKLSLIHI